VTHVSARHLPPMVRRRPLGPLAQAHAGVEAGLAAVRVYVWLRSNDPERRVSLRPLSAPSCPSTTLPLETT
jgi:hypothetical protein